LASTLNHGAERAICLGSEVEVALGQTADLVRPDLHSALAPCDVQIGMVSLLLRYVGDLDPSPAILKRFEPALARGLKKYSAGLTPVRTGFYLGKTMSKTTKVDVKVDVASFLSALVMLVLIIVT
jgi:hypothetical protein